MDGQIKPTEITIVNSDEKTPIVYGEALDLYANREKTAASITESDDPLVSIYFQAYNHLEDYTKPALDALFRYTRDIDYELILVDNGSTDGTFEYFKSIQHPRKRIYRITRRTLGRSTAILLPKMRPVDVFCVENILSAYRMMFL